jgi:TrmH family RNA methyltransferase
VKASMGAIFGIPVAAAETPGQFLSWCRERAVAIAVTSGKGSGTLWDTALPSPLAILLGSEGEGLPDDLLAAGDLRLRIPMTGTAESLNLAVATGILLYEAWRQLRTEGGPGGRTEP